MAEWWLVIYALAPAVDEVNITFTKLESRSLLILQQKDFVNALIDTLTNMFCVESVHPDERD